MNVGFYIHGVPRGLDVWGTEQDRDYIKCFYSSTYTEEVRFVVEVIPSRRKSFYTYIVGKNVLGSEGRSGSFFAMTISFERAFCTDVYNLFHLFKIIFEKLIVGTLLTNQNGSYRYISGTFDGKEKELNAIKAELLRELNQFIDDFEAIDGSFAASPSQVVLFNNLDVDSPSFYETLKRTLKVYVSPEYQTKDEYIAKLKKKVEIENSNNQQLSEELKTIKAQLSSSNNSASQLKSENKNLKNRCNILEGQVANMSATNIQLAKEKDEMKNMVTILEGQVAEDKTTNIQLSNEIKELKNKKPRLSIFGNSTEQINELKEKIAILEEKNKELTIKDNRTQEEIDWYKQNIKKNHNASSNVKHTNKNRQTNKKKSHR